MHHTKPSHRILAVLLSVMLCVSMLPVTALAEDADTGAENDAGIVDTEETAAEAPAEEAPVTEEEPAVEEAPAEESPAAEVMEEATELDPGVPETETLAEDGSEAITGTCGENLTWRLFNGTLTISGTGAMENFGERNTPWYSKRTTISTVVIESGVTNITDWLLGNCTALTSISIPESVTSIGIRPFIGCTALTSLSIPESVTSIGEGAFANCSALTSINIPAGVTSITWGEFWNCTSLASISIPNGVTSIEDNAFNNCDALTSVRIPDSVTSIGEYAFYSCGGLTDISIPDSVTSIGQKAFCDCDALVHVSLPKGITSISRSAFFSCSALTGISIPESVTSIGIYAFDECNALADVYYGGTEAQWSSINIAQYNDCLTKATIHYEAGFGSCGENLTWRLADGTLTISGTGAMDEYLGDKVPWAAYKSTISTVVIENGVTSICGYAFNHCESLTSISIPEGVTSIGDCAFSDCSALTNICIPSSVTSIEKCTFSRCSSLASVSIPVGVTSIGTCAFSDCSALTSIEIPAGVTSTGCSAFEGCSALTSIGLPNGLTSIGHLAFSGCSALKSVTLPESVTLVGDYAFNSCSSLTSISIPKGVTSIGYFAFADCDTLTNVYYGGSRARWGSISIDEGNDCLTGAAIHFADDGDADVLRGACGENINWTLKDGTLTISGTGAMDDYSRSEAPWYANRTEISTAVIESGVTSIGGDAFDSCTALTDVYYGGTEAQWGSISIGDGNTCLTEAIIHYNTAPISGICGENINWTLKDGTLTISGSGAMDDYGWGEAPWNEHLGEIRTIVIEDGVTSIGDRAFCNCSALTSVSIPESVTSIGSFAFAACSAMISITIPEGVTSIGENAFYYCEALTSIDIPESVTSIGSHVFSDCSSLTSVNIPEGVTSIGDYAFAHCSSLTSVNIPEGVACIGAYAFAYCDSMAYVIIPASMIAPSAIGKYAFHGCTALTDVYYGGTEAQWKSLGIDSSNSELIAANVTLVIAVAVIGTVRYQTLAAALSAAGSGDTVRLLADATNPGYVIVKTGVTLDLCGHNLTDAELLFVTGSLVDSGSSKGAFSAGAYYMNNGEHTQFPVYNSAAGTYSLYEIGFYASATKAPKYRFGLDRAGDGTDAVAATALMKSDANQGRVVAMVTVSWTQGEGSSAVDVSKTFTFTPNYMSAYLVSPFTKSFAITLSGMDSVGTVKAQPKFVVLDNNNSVMYTYAGPVWNIG